MDVMQYMESALRDLQFGSPATKCGALSRLASTPRVGGGSGGETLRAKLAEILPRVMAYEFPVRFNAALAATRVPQLDQAALEVLSTVFTDDARQLIKEFSLKALGEADIVNPLKADFDKYANLREMTLDEGVLRMRSRAVDALARMTGSSAASRLLEMVLERTSEKKARKQILFAIAALGDPASRECLAYHARTDPVAGFAAANFGSMSTDDLAHQHRAKTREENKHARWLLNGLLVALVVWILTKIL